ATMSGPVSQALQAELLAEVRRQGIVVWLDKDASYTGFVDRLAAEHEGGDFPYPVIGFRGSFLETLFALEAYGSGYEKHSLVVHMPGFNEDSIRTTPVLELYAAGTRFRKALDTLVRQAATGRVLPDEVEGFLRDNPTLEKADEWLALSVSKRTVGLEALLDSSGPTLIVEALGNKGGPLVGRVTTDEEAGALRSYLHKLTGMDDEWLSFAMGDPRAPILDRVLSAFSAWVLCVEYVHDLRREPHLAALKRLRALSKPLVEAAKGIVGQLRRSHPEAYAGLADEAESMLDIELKAMEPEDLGQIDTFREEENRVLRGAVEVLKEHAWARAADWAKAREGERSFWLHRDPVRRRAWNLVAEAAAFGKILAEHPRPFEGLAHFEEALARYAESAAPVDRAHRRFEQEWLRRLDTQMPHYGALQEVLWSLRQLHRTWVDQLTKDFTRLCKGEGFLPPPELQQRTLYEQVVQPMAFGDEKVAVFLVDAFRYEMATELVEDLRAMGGGAVVDLKARFAELPTITSVGMNALAPVAQNGRLAVTGALQGFKSGEVTVRSPGDRAKAMGNRTGGKPGLRLTLSEICDSSPEGLKRKVKEHQIVVVCSSEIDDAGEANVGLLTFDAQLGQLKAAWRHLQTAGLKHAVFTADHGFLLQDSTTAVHQFGKATDPHPRYVLDPHERAEAGMVPVPLSKLGYDGIGGYLLLREDTAVFRTGTVGASFVHGGNSPEERIIPVLTVTRKRAESSSLSEYAIEAKVMDAAFGFHRLQVRLMYAQQTLGFVGARSIDLDLRVPERRDIRVTVKEVTGAGSIKSGRIQSPVGDAWTEVYFALEGAADERVRVEI
ncbi:MAG: BREX-6 system phosphatase PglZ, partial [Polyangiaceae bacterium]|nr:BREX-6 system phosphatase PglZ [Polyangiaceae bacterium]